MSKKSGERNQGDDTKKIILVILIVVLASFFGYTVYKDYKREECANRLRSEYKNNLWLQNEIQARCGK